MPYIELLYKASLDACPSTPAIHLAVWNAHPHPLLTQWCHISKTYWLQQFFKPFTNLIHQQGLNSSFHPPEKSNLSLLFPSKNKQQTLYQMAQAMYHLEEGGQLWMACANTHGAKSYQHALEQLAGDANGRSKSKCRIFSARKTSDWNANLATAWKQAGEVQRLASHQLYTQAGLFSWDRADIGSQLLLQHLPQLSGRGMDLCCGYGLLSTHLWHHHAAITHLHLVDAAYEAIVCAKQNTTQWQEQCHYHWLDAQNEPIPDQMDWIVCNPPFHTGQEKDLHLGQQIIAKACQSLKHGGSLWMVANRKLPYEATLQSHLKQHETVVESHGFKIIHGVR